VVDRADELLTDDLAPAERPLTRRDRFPVDARHARRHAAEDLALEVRDDLGTPLAPPRLRRRDLRAAPQSERIGQLRVRIRARLVVVRVVGLALVAARPG